MSATAIVALANVLAALDLDVGERVAVLAKNSIEYVLLYYAASKAASGSYTGPVRRSRSPRRPEPTHPA